VGRHELGKLKKDGFVKLLEDEKKGEIMVNRFRVAVINKDSLQSESYKRFSDRNYSKKTLQNYMPDIEKAKLIERKRGFSIYEVPLKKSKLKKLKKGDEVKIVVPFRGFGEYGLRKGSTGVIIKSSTYRGMPSYEVDFPSSGKQLSMYHYELQKVK